MMIVIITSDLRFDIRNMSTPEHQTLKKKLLEACIVKQQSLIDDFNVRIRNLLDSQGLGNEEEYDSNELSQKAQAAEEINSINEALSLANEEMAVLDSLQRISKEEAHNVSPGAVVATNRDTFFISASIEQFDLDGDTWIGLSTKSPLYKAMKGKKKGDSFKCNGIAYKILDLF